MTGLVRQVRSWFWPVVLGLMAAVLVCALVAATLVMQLALGYGFAVLAVPITYTVFCLLAVQLFGEAIALDGWDLGGGFGAVMRAAWLFSLALLVALTVAGVYASLVATFNLLRIMYGAVLIGPLIWLGTAKWVHWWWQQRTFWRRARASRLVRAG